LKNEKKIQNEEQQTSIKTKMQSRTMSHEQVCATYCFILVLGNNNNNNNNNINNNNNNALLQC